MQKAVRKRNRQIHKATISKGGKRKLNQSPKYVFGFQLFGRVQMPDGRKGFIFGRRSSGSFDVRKLDEAKLSAGISRKTQAFREAQNNIDGKEHAASSPCLKAGVSAA
ncbi:MAG: hypothetical protein LBU32_04825, partial [Clostridiales bacterium]|jgi:N6-L-threonylcarbamoyladenine synthase|nr:hypothetical protein [Clostridiales bacterium]